VTLAEAGLTRFAREGGFQGAAISLAEPTRWKAALLRLEEGEGVDADPLGSESVWKDGACVGSVASDLFEKGWRSARRRWAPSMSRRTSPRRTSFTRPFQEAMTAWCWGFGWGDDAIDAKTRSMMNLAMIGALGKMHEWEIHCRGALNNGVTQEEIRAIDPRRRHLLRRAAGAGMLPRGAQGAGGGVHTHNLEFRNVDAAYEFATNLRPAPAPAQQDTFMGFHRPSGRVGTRNFIAVLTSVNCSATAARMIADHFTPERLAAYPNVDGVAAFTHGTGCGMAGRARGSRRCSG
jgi:alkylhydroperoxidase/carboxymuconolactone decarboxylase family protein YurZ